MTQLACLLAWLGLAAYRPLTSAADGVDVELRLQGACTARPRRLTIDIVTIKVAICPNSTSSFPSPRT